MKLTDAFNLTKTGAVPVTQKRMTTDQVIIHVTKQVEASGSTIKANWGKKWLASKSFVLLEIPLGKSAAIRPTLDKAKVIQELKAGNGEFEPIVIDVNKRNVGQAAKGFVPSTLILEGEHRHAAAQMAGKLTIMAWVGELAIKRLGLMASNRTANTELDKAIAINVMTALKKSVK